MPYIPQILAIKGLVIVVVCIMPYIILAIAVDAERSINIKEVENQELSYFMVCILEVCFQTSLFLYNVQSHYKQACYCFKTSLFHEVSLIILSMVLRFYALQCMMIYNKEMSFSHCIIFPVLIFGKFLNFAEFNVSRLYMLQFDYIFNTLISFELS